MNDDLGLCFTKLQQLYFVQFTFCVPKNINCTSKLYFIFYRVRQSWAHSELTQYYGDLFIMTLSVCNRTITRVLLLNQMTSSH